MFKKETMHKVILVFLCVSLFLTGCVSRDSYNTTSSEDSTRKVYFIQQDTNNQNGNNSNNNTSNNKSDNETDNNSDSGDSQDDGGTTNSDTYSAISTGEWKQERFYLGSCVCPTDRANLQIMKDAGYNLMEMTTMYSHNANLSAAEICDDLGLYYIMSDPSNITLHKVSTFSETSVRNTVYSLKDFKNMVGYAVWDEPLLGDNNSNVSKAKRMIDYLNKYDPNSLKFMNMLPSYGIYVWDSTDYNWENNTYAQYVEAFIRDANPSVVSVDYYPYLMGHTGDTSNWWRDMGLHRQMAAKYNKPFWYYYQQISINGEPTPTDSEIRYQMYEALAYGAKTLIAWNADVYSDGQKSATFEDAKKRNNEIMAVGSYLLDKTSVKLYHTGAADAFTSEFYTDKLSTSDLIASAPTRMSLGVFEDGKTNNKYLLVINRDTTAAKSGTITLKTSKSISKFNTETSTENPIGNSDSISFNIPAGDGALYILK